MQPGKQNATPLQPTKARNLISWAQGSYYTAPGIAHKFPSNTCDIFLCLDTWGYKECGGGGVQVSELVVESWMNDGAVLRI